MLVSWLKCQVDIKPVGLDDVSYSGGVTGALSKVAVENRISRTRAITKACEVRECRVVVADFFSFCSATNSFLNISFSDAGFASPVGSLFALACSASDIGH